MTDIVTNYLGQSLVKAGEVGQHFFGCLTAGFYAIMAGVALLKATEIDAIRYRQLCLNKGVPYTCAVIAS